MSAMRKPRVSSKKKGGRSRRDLMHPSASAISYRGGSDLRSDKAENLITASLVLHTYVTTTSVANVFTYATVFAVVDAAGATDWSSYISLYQEFRVLAERVEYFPKFANNQFNTNSAAAVVFATDRQLSRLYLLPYRGDSTAIANITSAVNHRQPGSVSGSADQRLSTSIRMDESDEAVFSKTTSSAVFPIFGIKAYMEGQTNGATDVIQWGTIIRTFTIQFRGRVDVSTQIARIQAAPQAATEGLDKITSSLVVSSAGAVRSLIDPAVSDYYIVRGPPPLKRESTSAASGMATGRV